MTKHGIIIALLVLAGPARADKPGAIHGRVVYDGTAPARSPLKVDVNIDVCAKHGPVLGEDLLVGKDRGLANVVLFLAGITERAPVARDAKLDQRGCVFLPHVQSVTAGSTLVIGNDDPVVHNVHARVDGETVFNLGMPLRGVHIKRRMKAPGVTVLSCDSGHKWMLAYVVVVPHGYHSTSSAEGEFTITDIQPGTYTLRAWHERLGIMDVPVTVRAGLDTEVTLSFGSKSARDVPLTFATAAEPRVTVTATMAPAIATEGDQEVALTARRAQRDVDHAAGRMSYLRHCASCHGDAGDGHGEAARWQSSRPRDFTRGEIELRSTRSGEPAREEDLVRTISLGVPGTDMPAWAGELAPSERRLLARYVMSLSDRYYQAPPSAPVVIPQETTRDAASVARGKEIWNKLKCNQCHGDDGGSPGASHRLVDDWGEDVDAADLRRSVYKSGPLPADLYRTLVTGLSGTPMPAFSDLISPSETWDLVHFIQTLAREPGLFDWLFSNEKE